jgi:hypothetical protein
VTSSARQAADRYFAAVNARDADALAEIFATSGLLLLPTGGTVDGGDAIRAFYRRLFEGASVPSPQAIRHVDDGRQCAVEMVPRLPPGADLADTTFFELFTVDEEGKIVELSIFWRQPGPTERRATPDRA